MSRQTPFVGFLVLLHCGMLAACQPTSTTSPGTPAEPTSSTPPQSTSSTPPSLAPTPSASAQTPTPESPSNPSPSGNPGTTTQSIDSLQLESERRFLTGIGDQIQLQLRALDTQGRLLTLDPTSIRYVSSRPDDIQVDNTGKVQALKDFGYSTIQVEVQGKSVTLLLSVSNTSIGGSSRTRVQPPELSLTGLNSVQAGRTLTLSGNNLQNITGLTLDGVAVTLLSQNSNQIQIRVPATTRSGILKSFTNGGSLPQQTLTLPLNHRIWFVNVSATGQNNGDNWTDAFTDLQSALAVAQPGDEIWLAQGKYLPSQMGDRTVFFNVPAEVALYGGFIGGESFFDDRNIADQKATLSGDLSNNDVYGSLPFTNAGDNSLNILRHGANVTLDGLIIEGAYTDQLNGLSSPRGSGIYSAGNSLILKNSILRNLYSVDRSGGWENNGGNASVENVSFFRVASGGSAAGCIYNTTGTMAFKNVTFDNCVNNGGGGGALRNESGNLSFTDVTFQNNQANGTGGAGIYNTGGNLTFQTVSFLNHQANGGGGGGIKSTSGAVVIKEATFEGNQSNGGGGGGIQMSGGSLSLENASFTQGSATGAGGSGIYASNASVNLKNIRFSQNTHSLGTVNVSGSGGLIGDQLTFENNNANSPGGGIYSSSTLTLTNSSFENVNSTSVGGGIYHSNGQAFTLKNTSFINCKSTNGTNSAGPGGGVYLTGSSTATLENLTFTQNSSDSTGGGLYATSVGTLQLKNSVFSENNANSPGGGVYLNGTNLLLNGVSFKNNSSQSFGGGAYLSGTSAELSNFFFTGNSSQNAGGGLYLSLSNSANLNQGIFNNNATNSEGGGLYTAGGTLNLVHTTFGENSANTSGDAVFLSSGNSTLRNSIVWDSEATPIAMDTGTLTSLYSVLKDLGSYTLEAGSTGNTSADPLFNNLIDLDGPDNRLGTQDDGLSLGNLSSALNLDTSNATVMTTDITGRLRDSQPDAGAYEK